MARFLTYADHLIGSSLPHENWCAAGRGKCAVRRALSCTWRRRQGVVATGWVDAWFVVAVNTLFLSGTNSKRSIGHNTT